MEVIEEYYEEKMAISCIQEGEKAENKKLEYAEKNWMERWKGIHLKQIEPKLQWISAYDLREDIQLKLIVIIQYVANQSNQMHKQK